MLVLGPFAGCGYDDAIDPSPSPSRALFAADVQPRLAERCANPSCHGRAERPLSLYAPLRFRADPARLFFDEPLTRAELRHNYDRARGFVLQAYADGDADAALLLAKATATTWHAGGAALLPDDDAAEAIRAWIESGW